MKDFLLLLLSEDNKRKKDLGPILLEKFNSFNLKDQMELRKLLENSPYSEIPKLSYFYGDEKYPYNLMRAGLYIREESPNSRRAKYPKPGKYFGEMIGNILFETGFHLYTSRDPGKINLALDVNYIYLRQFKRWCNLVVNKPGHHYIIDVGRGSIEKYKYDFWLEIIEIGSYD